MNDIRQKKSAKTWIKWVIAIAVIVIAVSAIIIVDSFSNRSDVKLTIDEAQNIIDSAFNALPTSNLVATYELINRTEIKAKDIRYGNEKDIIVSCSYSTVNIGKVVNELKDSLFVSAYDLYVKNNAAKIKTNATKFMLAVFPDIIGAMDKAEVLNGEIDIYIYEMNDGTAKIYLNDETVNTCLGGILDAQKLIKEVEEIEYNGETVSIVNQATIRTGISDCIGLKNYDSARPNTGTPLMQWWADFCDEFYRNFIRNNQWMYLAKGLLTTIEITFLALILGVVLGFLAAIIRVTYSKTGKAKPLSDICQLYVAIIRGTPVMVQLLIIYFVLLLPIGVEKFPAAVLCFGLNSGAYVSEIVRGGIMSVDNGQTEAGRSLGFGYAQTMIHIVIPQAFKAVLPALANEFITLLKESSVAFYIGVADLTQGGIKIRSITYSNFMPLVAVALIYLVVVLGLTKLVSLLEKRLQKGDR